MELTGELQEAMVSKERALREESSKRQRKKEMKEIRGAKYIHWRLCWKWLAVYEKFGLVVRVLK